MGKILGYARTSTSKQEIENQIIALKDQGVHLRISITMMVYREQQRRLTEKLSKKFKR
jgi:DNA invertase Pin-like site-specific DNA recombinase